MKRSIDIRLTVLLVLALAGLASGWASPARGATVAAETADETAAARATAPTGLVGYVLDAATGRPVKGAVISVSGKSWRAVSGANGYYLLNGAAGTWTVNTAAPFHRGLSRRLSLTAGRRLRADWRLTALKPGSLSTTGRYLTGSPSFRELWVDPRRGSDSASGASRTAALRTVAEAWRRVPIHRTLTRGYRINLVSAAYTEAVMPDNCWFEERWGTYYNPVVFRSVDGTGRARLPGFQLFDCRFIYLDGVRVTGRSDYSLHVSSCAYVLIRKSQIIGLGDIATYDCPQESLKANQCRNLYVEDSEVAGAWNVALDFVACRDGHVVGNRIHRAGDWAAYLKGGSARFRVEGNELFDAGNGGFTAGQGAGLEFMVSPFLHYEAYDIKFINNVVHDVAGAGVGVNGGFNILLAYNTMYRVGRNSHAIELNTGRRSCDGDVAACQARLAAGGWGTSVPYEEIIVPARNVYVYNNLVYDTAGYSSAWSHFMLPAAVSAAPGSNLTSPVRADFGLFIRGNLLWNMPVGLDLGLADALATDAAEPAVRAHNKVNALAPQFAVGSWRPLAGGTLARSTSWAVPSFPGNDYPSRPTVPKGSLSNTVTRDRAGNARPAGGPPGAYCR